MVLPQPFFKKKKTCRGRPPERYVSRGQILGPAAAAVRTAHTHTDTGAIAAREEKSWKISRSSSSSSSSSSFAAVCLLLLLIQDN